jgi:hypothetical protein
MCQRALFGNADPRPAWKVGFTYRKRSCSFWGEELLRLLTAVLVQVFGRRDDGLSTHSYGRRPKSAKARNRVMWGVAVPRALWGFCRGLTRAGEGRSGGAAHLAAWVRHDGEHKSGGGFVRRDFACFGPDDAPIRCGGASFGVVGGEPTQAANVIGAVAP